MNFQTIDRPFSTNKSTTELKQNQRKAYVTYSTLGLLACEEYRGQKTGEPHGFRGRHSPVGGSLDILVERKTLEL